LSGPFFVAYAATLTRLINAKHFFRHFPKVGSGFDYEPAEERLKELIGSRWTPISYSEVTLRPRREEEILDTIEAFWRLSEEKASYTAEVNALFSRFNQPFKIEKGSVKRRGSEVLEKLFAAELSSTDEVVIKYIEAAVESFFYAKEDRRLEGLRSLYDAYDRLKSSLNSDKRESIRELIKTLAPPSLGKPFDELLNALTSIGNEANIRHSEHRVTLIDHDPELIEFLFYSLYSLIRLSLQRLAAT
jgi:hypothetical protein